MCYPIGARLAQRRILALDTLYHHLFSIPGRDATTTSQLKHDLVLWLTHHSFEELPDALEYYLADPNSDLEGNLAHLTCLDPWGVQVHIHPLVTIYINTLLAWAKCFIATYGVYPGLYDLLDTPRLDFLAAQLHLRDTTLPRPLLHQSRGPPTIRSEYVALQPHLAPPPHPIVCTSVARTVRPSPRQSVVRPVRPSSRQPPQYCPSTPPSVMRHVHQTVRHRPTICTPSYHVCPAVLRHPVCTTHQPVRQTIRHHPNVCTTHQPVRQTIRHRPNVCTTTPPVRQTIRHRHTVCTTHQSVRQPVRHQPTV